jgi:Tol biopolymer transport system component
VPKNPARGRRSTATLTSVSLVLASAAVLLVNPATTPLASAAAAPGSPHRATVRGEDTQVGDGGFKSMLSGNGESVAFSSFGEFDNLKTGGLENVYVRDLVKRRTVMISRGRFVRPNPSSSSSQQPPVIKLGPEQALNLQAPLAKRAQQLPTVDVTPDGSSSDPTVSADGRFVAFSTTARNMILEDDSSTRDIVICDRDPNNNGVYDEDVNGVRDYKYYRVPRGEFSGSRNLPKLSANASRVAWRQGSEPREIATSALNLPAGTIGAAEHVPDNLGENGPFDVSDIAISGDGNHIVMRASYFTGEGSGHEAILSTDMVKREVTRVDFEAPGKPVSNNFDQNVAHPAVNVDGTVIAFVGEDFGEGSADDEPNVYVVRVNYALPSNRVTSSRIVSRDNVGNLINADRPGLSADGRYIAFVTDALRAHDGTDGATQTTTCIDEPSEGLARQPVLRLNAALPPPRNQPRTFCQVVMRDLVLDAQLEAAKQRPVSGTLVSPTGTGNAANGDSVPSRGFSTAPSLSSDGRRVGYDSDASNIVGNDTNQRTDAYVRVLAPTLQGDAVNFGPVKVGESLIKTARVNHIGAGPLDVEQITISGPNGGDFAVGAQTCQGQTIHQTGGCDISVKFTPSALGDRRGQLRIRLRGGREMAPIDLLGNGSRDPTPPTFEIAPDQLNFGARLLLSNGPEAAVTVTNRGETALTISAVTIVGPGAPGDYTIASNTCATAVATNASCRVAVRFSPKLAGTRDAILRFDHNIPGTGPRLVGLKGSGNQPTIEVNPGVTAPGRAITVIGKQFPPGKAVTVKFDGRVGQATVVAAADGSFRVPLLVYPKATPETRSVLGTVDGFADPLAKAPLLIVFATVSPAEFVIRN